MQQTAENAGATAVLLLSDGKQVLAWGDQTTPTPLHSAVKVILSTLVATCLGDDPGQIPLEATLAELGIDDTPPLTDAQRQIRVIDLLRSVSGVARDASAEIPVMRAHKRRLLGDGKPPGTTWSYNNWDYNVLITILQRRTGKTMSELLRSNLVDPLGLQDVRPRDVRLNYDWPAPGGYHHPHVHIELSARDMARFGQLFIDDGVWNGRRLLPEGWVNRIKTDYELTGRGPADAAHSYLWWLPMGPPVEEAGIPKQTFYASGLAGQRIFIFPKWHSVLVLKADTRRFNTTFQEFAEQEGLEINEPSTMSTYLSRVRAAECGPVAERTGLCAQVPFIDVNEEFEILKALVSARRSP